MDAVAPGQSISVTVVDEPSSPIELSQAAILTGAAGTRLWIVYRNVSRETVDRFAVTFSWRNGLGHTFGTTFKMVNSSIGPGESTTTELSNVGTLHANAQPYARVTRARYHDLALWVAPPPPPPPAAAAGTAQAIAGRVPVTTMNYPNGPGPRPTATAATAAPVAGSAYPGPTTMPSAPASAAVLAQGTAIDLKLGSDISSSTASDGDRVDFTVAADVSAGGVVLVASGLRGLGHLEGVRRAGRFGRSGSFTVVPDLIVMANGAIVPLQGATVVRPGPTALAVLADLTIFGGFFARGRDAVLSAGSVVRAATATQIAASPSLN